MTDKPLEIADYDFLDFGASNGGSISWASRTFGGRGFGVDIDPAKVEKLRARGFDGMVADATALDIPDSSVRYVTMMHFLEHLPGPELGLKMFQSAIRVAQDFVFMIGPDFADADYLETLGFKKYYADWSGHTWHHQIRELKEILALYPQYPSRLYQVTQIYDSYDRVIQPLEAPRNSQAYDPGQHPAKPFQVFDRKIYETDMIVVQKNPEISIDRIMTLALRMQLHHGQDTVARLYDR